MDLPGDLDRVIAATLHRMLGRQQISPQLFLFGPSGDPFFAARTPISGSELACLEAATRLIERLEPGSPKPFLAHDVGRRFAVAALGGTADLFVVVLAASPDRPVVEARVIAIRDELVAEPSVMRLSGLLAAQPRYRQ